MRKHTPVRRLVLLIQLLGMIFLAGTEGIATSSSFTISDAVEYNKIISTNAVLTTNATYNFWLEGPVWMSQNGGFLLFTGNNALKKLVPPNTLADFCASPPANTKFNG